MELKITQFVAKALDEKARVLTTTLKEHLTPHLNDIKRISLMVEKMAPERPFTSKAGSSGTSCAATQPVQLAPNVDLDQEFKPVDNDVELEALVANLSDKHTRLSLMNQLKSRVSSNYLKNRPGAAFYYFIDLLFTRKFLLTASWTGVSTSTNKKIRIQEYVSVHTFFLELIRHFEPNCSNLQYETLMKRVLGNSKGRSEAKFLRQSAPRRQSRRQPRRQPAATDSAAKRRKINSADAEAGHTSIKEEYSENDWSEITIEENILE